MLMQLKTIQTKLETATVDEIQTILNFKVEAVGANQTADYIGRAVENIESSVDRIDDAIKELQAIKKDMQSQSEVIKIGAARWLSECGIDKLQGDRISSISVSDKKESIKLIVEDEDNVINAGYFKTVIDSVALKNALVSGVDIDGVKLEIVHNEPSLRINKRKAK